MTVEAYLRARVPNYPIGREVLEGAVISPLFSKPRQLRAIELEATIEENYRDKEFMDSLKYALSTLYYTLSGSVGTGGSMSERVGDASVSKSGYTLSSADRALLRKSGDDIRDELRLQREASVGDSRGMFDATALRGR